MTIKVLAAGQSNMIGKPSTNVPNFSTVSPLVRVWNNVNPLGGVGSQFVTAAEARLAGTFQHTDRNTLSPWFADKLARTQYDSVDLTVVARGASSVSYWDPSEVNYPMLAATVDVWNATGQGPADVFLWHQGESDLDMPAEWYIATFESMVTNLKAANVLSDNSLILLGGLAETSAIPALFNRRVLMTLARKPNRGYARSTGLVTFDAGNTHFDSKSLTAFGAKRYYTAYMFARDR